MFVVGRFMLRILVIFLVEFLHLSLRANFKGFIHFLPLIPQSPGHLLLTLHMYNFLVISFGALMPKVSFFSTYFTSCFLYPWYSKLSLFLSLMRWKVPCIPRVYCLGWFWPWVTFTKTKMDDLLTLISTNFALGLSFSRVVILCISNSCFMYGFNPNRQVWSSWSSNNPITHVSNASHWYVYSCTSPFCYLLVIFEKQISLDYTLNPLKEIIFETIPAIGAHFSRLLPPHVQILCITFQLHG